MTDKELPNFDALEIDADAPALIDRGVVQTQSIDLQRLMLEFDSALGPSDLRVVHRTSFGKLLDALPIPALLIDRSRTITFLNEACDKITPRYLNSQNDPFSDLFPDHRAAKEVQRLLEQVFEIRQTQIIEAALRIGKQQVWARVHLRSLRWGRDALILALVEDLTLEKRQLGLQNRLRKELEKRVEERTRDLERSNELLQSEIGERKAAEEELRKHRQHLEELVVERTRELNDTVKRLKQEVKERKKIENSLRSSERRFNVAFQASPGCVSISTLNGGRYLEVNESFCRTTGHKREEVVGKTEAELNYWARLGHRDQMVRTLLERGALRDFEAVFRSKEGKMHVGSLSAEIIELDGEPYVLAITTDITERKRAERHHKRLTTAMEQAAESIIVTDSRGFVKYANPAFEAMSGYSGEEILGKNLSIFRSPDNDPARLSGAKQQLAQGLTWKGLLVNRTKDGTAYEVETTISPVRGQSERIINFVIVERDVTNEMRLERQLRQAQKMEAIGTLAGGIAHDFNNILTAIMGYAELAIVQSPDGSRARKDMEEVMKASIRAKDLANQILTFSRQTEQERRAVEVRLVFKEALKLLRASIPATVDIHENMDPDTGCVMADPTQMHQLIMNLCTNAYQAMDDRRGAISVRLTKGYLDPDSLSVKNPEMKPGIFLRLSVSDTGCGISPELLERIFDPFFTTKELGKGTGMGLSVVHGIVTSHGGGIAVNSRPGKGTEVQVFLPWCDTDLDPQCSEAAMVVRGTGSIMAVDDETQIVDIVGRVLESLGYRVTGMTDARGALQTFRERPDDFDLLITDLTMPGITGLELAEAIIQLRPGFPVVMCTGFGEMITKEKAQALGIRDFIVKPMVPAILSKAVSDALLRVKPAARSSEA